MASQKMETRYPILRKVMQFFVATFVASYSLCSVAATSRPWDAEIFYQINREAWVKSTTARVDIAINMTLGREGLAKARKTILTNLQTLGKVDWQLTNFNRERDQSGLEQVAATATARFSETDLDGLRDRATSISHPGSNYTVSTIDFTPSLNEMESARDTLRLQIMQAVKQQLADVKKTYPDQNYQITSMNFQTNEVTPMQYPRRAMMAMASEEKSMNSTPLTVSQKITLSVNVVISVPNPKQ